MDNPASESSSASPTRSRFSIERIEAPSLTPMLSNESDKLSESTTGRFSVNPISDVAGTVQQAGQSHPSENVEIMSGSVSSTVSSGGNNTPYASGTPTSTVHPQNAKQVDKRYFS